jgi:hypothetical protein
MEIKLMTLMRFMRLLSHLGRTLLLGLAILLGCKGVQEVGGRRRVMVLGGGLSPYSLLYFWGIC